MTGRFRLIGCVVGLSALTATCASGERPATSLVSEGVLEERALLDLQKSYATPLPTIAPRVEAVCLLSGYEADEGEWTTLLSESLQQQCAFCPPLEPGAAFSYAQATFLVHSGGRVSHFGPETLVAEFTGSGQDWRDQESPPCFRPQQALASVDDEGRFHLVISPV